MKARLHPRRPVPPLRQAGAVWFRRLNDRRIPGRRVRSGACEPWHKPGRRERHDVHEQAFIAMNRRHDGRQRSQRARAVDADARFARLSVSWFPLQRLERIAAPPAAGACSRCSVRRTEHVPQAAAPTTQSAHGDSPSSASLGCRGGCPDRRQSPGARTPGAACAYRLTKRKMAGAQRPRPAATRSGGSVVSVEVRGRQIVHEPLGRRPNVGVGVPLCAHRRAVRRLCRGQHSLRFGQCFGARPTSAPVPAAD